MRSPDGLLGSFVRPTIRSRPDAMGMKAGRGNARKKRGRGRTREGGTADASVLGRKGVVREKPGGGRGGM